MAAAASSTSLARTASRDSSLESKSNAVQSTSASTASSTVVACRTILASSVIRTEWASSHNVWFKRVTKAVFCESFTYLSIQDFFRFALSCKSAQALCSDALIWNKLAVRFDLERPAPPAALYHQLKVERDLAKKTIYCFTHSYRMKEIPILEKTNYKQLFKIVSQNKDRLVSPLCYFARNTLFDCVKIILTSKEMTESYRGEAVVYAASKPSTEVLKEILSSGIISALDRSRALSQAAEHFNLENVKILIASGPTLIYVSAGAIQLMLRFDPSNPHLFEIAQRILDLGTPSKEWRILLIALAQKEGRQDIAQLLSPSRRCVIQ